MATRKVAVSSISFPAVPIIQNKQRFFFTTIPVSKLFPYCFVSGRDSDPLAGFQRNLNAARARDIAKYLHEGQGSIPTNIVLSAQSDSGLAYNSRTKTLKYPGAPSSFLVLDGQHRLFGYQLCLEKYGVEYRVPVSIYEGLSRSDEARLFIDINTTQVGVPSALLLDIKQVAAMETSSEEVLRALFDQLNKDDGSPLKGLLSPSKSVVGKISRVTFNRALDGVIKSNVWVNASPKTRYQLVVNYIKAVKANTSNVALLPKSGFFEAIFDVFPDVVQTSLSKHKNAKEASIKDVLKPIATIEFDKIVNRGKATRASYLEPIKKSLQNTVKISDAMV